MDSFRRRNGSQRVVVGMTLIELLVGLVLTGILSGIVLYMFQGEHRNYTATRDKVRLQTNAREAMRIMEEEIANVGFRSTTVSTDGVLAVAPCNTALFNGVDESGTPETGISISRLPTDKQSIRFRLLDPNPVALPSRNCADDVWTLSYRWNPDTKQLLRAATRGAATTVDEVPFLDSVDQFDVEFGVLATNEMVMNTASTLTAAELTASSDVGFAGTILTNPARPWIVNTWPQTAIGSVRLNRDIPLRNNAVYRLLFNAQAVAGFLDADNGADICRMVLRRKGTSERIEVPFRPDLDGVNRQFEYEFTPPVTGTWELLFEANVKNADPVSNPSPTAFVQNVAIEKVRETSYEPSSWFTKEAPGNWAAVRAVRITLKARSPKDGVVTISRTIPVPNIGF